MANILASGTLYLLNNPDCVYIVTGDFNQANLRSILPNYYQHVDFATRGEDTLDLVYTYI